MKEPIDRLTDELRDATKEPHVDWSTVDEKLFARVRAELAAERAHERRFGRVWIPMAAALAAAAAVAFVVGRAGDVAPIASAPAMAPMASEPTIVAAVERGAELLVDGKVAAKDARVPDGSRIEARGGRARLEAQGAATFVVDRGTDARLVHAGAALVVALERGAVEAEVTKQKPESARESFAVDVRGARVAARGTHLRVATEGDRVVVDLREGVLAIGDAPRSGATQGAIVAAPAHAEFSASDVNGTLRVDHDPASVRPAIAFAIDLPEEPTTAANQAPPVPAPALPPAAAFAPAPTLAPSPAPAPPPAPAASPSGPLVDPHPESTISSAVRACLAARTPPEGVNLSVSTNVVLKVGDDGAVQLARFDPPIAPDAQSCAANAIYKTRFGPSTRGGEVSIRVDYRYER